MSGTHPIRVKNTDTMTRKLSFILPLGCLFATFPLRADNADDPPRPDPANPSDYCTWARDHLFDSSPDGSSNPTHLATWAASLTPPPSNRDLQSAAVGPWEGMADLTDWLNSSSPAREQMARSVRNSKLAIVIEPAPNPPEGFSERWDKSMLTAVVPGLNAVRVFALAALADGWRHFSTGDESDMVPELAKVILAARQLEPCATFDARVLGDSVAGLAYETMLQAIARSRDPGKLAAAFKHELFPIDPPPAELDSAYQFEQLLALDTAQRLFVPHETDDSKSWTLDESAGEVYRRLTEMNAGQEFEEWDHAGKKLSAAGFDQSITDLTRYFIQIRKWRQMPYRPGLEKLYAFHGEVSRHDNPLIRLFCPNLTSPQQYHRRSVALRRGSRLLVHLLLLQQERGTAPSTLDELKGVDDLSDIRKDPFSDGDFVYVPIRDGFLLYSYGEDGKDDGGRPQPSPDRPGDLVFWTPR